MKWKTVVQRIKILLANIEMGCDGGTIPKRCELVKTKKKETKVERDEKAAARWKHCALTQQPLKAPIVACRLGRLYNKEAVIEALLKRKEAPVEGLNHISSLKDVKELKLTKNPAYDEKKADKGGEYADLKSAAYICPVSGLEMNGIYRFCFLWSCGCVLSEKCFKEIEGQNCHNCNMPFTAEDKIVLYGTDEEIEKYRESINKKTLKKRMKSSKVSVGTEAGTSGLTVSQSEANSSNVNSVKQSVFAENDVKRKKISIQDDPKASKVYKSLFTTSDAGKAQPRGHWVTYNPLYF
ncbi:Protein RTF2 -like protein [Trichinella patagoniensis]|uniref:Replication termination factor 2 n=1 Tax=Trichinella patagoniensis TaxID=990121 RepID=A0A0V1AA38_9BILA|nr:Protein RTF2 -like protein [Trichinella patagoniensis]